MNGFWPLTDLVRGVLDRYGVSCWWCSLDFRFYPTHEATYRARIQARTLGWFFSEHGWECPGCAKRRGKSQASRAQISLPGFGVLSRNAKT